jgi:hypothetical protein
VERLVDNELPPPKRRQRKAKVAGNASSAALAATETAEDIMWGKAAPTLATPAISEQLPSLNLEAQEDLDDLEAPQPLPAAGKVKTITVRHDELVQEFPADVYELERSCLDIYNEFAPAGTSFFTEEIPATKDTKARHTARHAVIHERALWVEKELVKEGISYGWKGGREPAAGSYALYRGVSLKYLRDRFNHKSSHEVSCGADMASRTAMKKAIKAVKDAGRLALKAKASKKRGKK